VSARQRANLYDRVAEETASIVIRRYSTSFGLAARLLDRRNRQRIENIYALVRVADEIVDGGAAAAGLSTKDAGGRLDALEKETEAAMACGYSSNLVVHAFALTARETGIGRALTQPFFESMRSDLVSVEQTPESFERYVYGSAEVVGLMCLHSFLEGGDCTDAERIEFEAGARALGAAFQKINFLRDLATDFRELGRSYFPGVRVDAFDEADKDRLLDDIEADLRVSAAVIPKLPPGSRRAVALAHFLFAELASRLRATPAAQLVVSRVRVPNPVKLRIAAGVALGRIP
jgi:phytoene synthase